MKILAIETSADETAAAVTEGRNVLSNIIFSQISMHKKWGGIFPALAKRAHEERIDGVVEEALSKLRYQTPNFKTKVRVSKTIKLSTERLNDEMMKRINCLAVTVGPGLAVALEIGIKKAKELAQRYQKKLITVNHLEGHIYSNFVRNRSGNPQREFKFPYLCLIVSGGHTELVLMNNHLSYKVLGETRDDAAGEALDKAAKLLGLGYPGGPVIERMASKVKNKDFYNFPRPMTKSQNLEFSFSGLKTSFYYFLQNENIKYNISELASSFQNAVFDTIVAKSAFAIKQTGVRRLLVGGGVSANQFLRKKLRTLMKGLNGEIYFPPFRYLTGDNAAMIGVVAYYKAKKGLFADNVDRIDRIPRLSISL